MNVPCKIKAGVFILCMEGYVCSTINLAEYKTTKSNIITLTPNSYIQVHEMSDDILIYFAAFSSDFMSYANFLRSTMSCFIYYLQTSGYSYLSKNIESDCQLL